MRTLREQLGQLQQAAGVSPVDQALVLVRQLAARPPNVFDPYALIGALENLEDVARRSGHQDLKKYAAVVSHCKKLPPNARLGDFVTHVLGDEVEREVAKTVAKMYSLYLVPIGRMRELVYPNQHPEEGVSNAVGLDILRVIVQCRVQIKLFSSLS